MLHWQDIKHLAQRSNYWRRITRYNGPAADLLQIKPTNQYCTLHLLQTQHDYRIIRITATSTEQLAQYYNPTETLYQLRLVINKTTIARNVHRITRTLAAHPHLRPQPLRQPYTTLLTHIQQGQTTCSTGPTSNG